MTRPTPIYNPNEQLSLDAYLHEVRVYGNQHGWGDVVSVSGRQVWIDAHRLGVTPIQAFNQFLAVRRDG